MDTVFILSAVVSVFSLALVLIGLPAQIVKNKRERRSGIPLLTILIALGFYLSQIVYFFVTESYFPFLSFVVGFMMWGIVFVQYFIYRK